jgi:hypothetical protein
LMGLGFELKASPLQSRNSIAWAMLPVSLLWLFWRQILNNYLLGWSQSSRSQLPK